MYNGLHLKMLMSINQLSLHGVVADLIQELLEDRKAHKRFVVSDQTEQEIHVQFPFAEVSSHDERQRIIILRSRFELGGSWSIFLYSSITG